VYSFFHQVIEEEKGFNVAASVALQMVIGCIVYGPFEEKYFRCFMTKKTANKFLGKIHSMAKDVPPPAKGQQLKISRS
jgi:hypothetical protein